MGTIDKTVYKLTCPQCGISETSSVLDKGSGWGGSCWDEKTSFSKFKTEWNGGGSQEPKLTLAACKACGGSATVESRYSL